MSIHRWKFITVTHEAKKTISHGKPVNYTAILKRTLTPDGKELSRQDDIGFQVWFSDYGNKIQYSEGSKKHSFFESKPLPPKTHEDWDKIYYTDTCFVAEQQLLNGRTILSKKKKPGLSAKIKLQGHKIKYTDRANSFVLLESERPKANHKDWNKTYYTSDKRYGMHYSEKKGVYRLFYKNKSNNTLMFDFTPLLGLFKSTTKAMYRLWWVDDSGVVQSFDYLPTTNFICADLTKAYGSVQRQQGIEIASTILLGIIQSYTSFTETTYYGDSQSTYSGVYMDSFGSGSWQGYGTSSFSAYSRTYDYSFVGDRAADYLSSIFNRNHTTNS